MNHAVQNISHCTRTLFWSLLPALYFPATARAQVPGGAGPKLQPALILALALTLLVLFCIYLFQRYKSSKGEAGQAQWTTEDNPFHTRLYETHRALTTLLDQPGIPMAKTALEQGRIMDATPALYQSLGYSKREFLRQGPDALGILPTGKDDIRQLADSGWSESRAELSHRTTGERYNCLILNIVTHLDGHPTVLSIIPGLAQPGPDAPAPSDPARFAGDLYDNG